MRGSRAGALITLALLLAAQGLPAQEETAGNADLNPDERVEKDYTPYPNPDSGYVTDLADLLTPDEEERIERWLWQVESRTDVEIIVVTINSIKDYVDTGKQTIEPFATGLFNAYGIGNMPKNDGILLLVAKTDRKARIELGAAYGRARDPDSRRIMDRKIVPHFRKGNFAKGITSGVKELMSEFAHVRVGINWSLVIMALAIPAMVMIAYSLFRSGKRGWGWVCVGIVFVLILLVVRIIVTVARHLPKGSSSSWGAGGMGGFGGGFSGGGGATGSW